MLDRQGGYLPARYLHCSRSRQKTDLVCFNFWGVHLPLVSICAIDPVVGAVVWQASLLA